MAGKGFWDDDGEDDHADPATGIPGAGEREPRWNTFLSPDGRQLVVEAVGPRSSDYDRQPDGHFPERQFGLYALLEYDLDDIIADRRKIRRERSERSEATYRDDPDDDSDDEQGQGQDQRRDRESDHE